jgi:hypothetical protein
MCRENSPVEKEMSRNPKTLLLALLTFFLLFVTACPELGQSDPGDGDAAETPELKHAENGDEGKPVDGAKPRVDQPEPDSKIHEQKKDQKKKDEKAELKEQSEQELVEALGRSSSRTHSEKREIAKKMMRRPSIGKPAINELIRYVGRDEIDKEEAALLLQCADKNFFSGQELDLMEAIRGAKSRESELALLAVLQKLQTPKATEYLLELAALKPALFLEHGRSGLNELKKKDVAAFAAQIDTLKRHANEQVREIGTELALMLPKEAKVPPSPKKKFTVAFAMEHAIPGEHNVATQIKNDLKQDGNLSSKVDLHYVDCLLKSGAGGIPHDVDAVMALITKSGPRSEAVVFEKRYGDVFGPGQAIYLVIINPTSKHMDNDPIDQSPKIAGKPIPYVAFLTQRANNDEPKKEIRAFVKGLLK